MDMVAYTYHTTCSTHPLIPNNAIIAHLHVLMNITLRFNQIGHYAPMSPGGAIIFKLTVMRLRVCLSCMV